MSTSNHRTGNVIAAAAILPAILFAVSSHAAVAAEHVAQATPGLTAPASPAQPAAAAAAKSHRVEARITELHKQLRITADQEVLWNDMAQVMRDNEQKMHDRITSRSTKLKTMTAVDDLRSYEMIADAHADGLKRLIPAFEALYAQMTPEQQKHADHVFGERQKQHAQHRS